MAVCEAILNGINRTCDTNIGGVARFWLADKGKVQGSIQTEDGKITAIGAKANWFEYQVRDETSTVSWAGVEGIGGTVAYWNYTVTLVIDRHDSTKSKEVDELRKAPLVLIFEDGNGMKWMLGADRGLIMKASTAGEFGTAFTDQNKYTLTFESAMPTLAPQVTCAVPPES